MDRVALVLHMYYLSLTKGRKFGLSMLRQNSVFKFCLKGLEADMITRDELIGLVAQIQSGVGADAELEQDGDALCDTVAEPQTGDALSQEELDANDLADKILSLRRMAG